MAYFWRCLECMWLGTFDDDEDPRCAFVTEDGTHYGRGFRGDPRDHSSPDGQDRGNSYPKGR